MNKIYFRLLDKQHIINGGTKKYKDIYCKLSEFLPFKEIQKLYNLYDVYLLYDFMFIHKIIGKNKIINDLIVLFKLKNIPLYFSYNTLRIAEESLYINVLFNNLTIIDFNIIIEYLKNNNVKINKFNFYTVSYNPNNLKLLKEHILNNYNISSKIEQIL